jgi:excisionase family DNA binding protein
LPTISDDNCDTELIMPYITKEQAAKILRTSTRGVERLVSRGKLHVTPEKVEGRTRLQPMYDEQLVQTLAAEMTPDAASIATNGDGELATNKDSGDTHPSEIDDAPTAKPTQALQRAPSEQSMTMFVAALSDALREAQTPGNGVSAVPLRDKLTLSIDEAAALAGLSANHIYVAIRKGNLKAKIIGRGWRVKRPDLDAYVKKL